MPQDQFLLTVPIHRQTFVNIISHNIQINFLPKIITIFNKKYVHLKTLALEEKVNFR